MDETVIVKYITEALGGVDTIVSDGNTFFFYDPGNSLPVDHRFPFATLMTNDLNDQASGLDRPSVYRLNIGVSKATFVSLFGASGDESAAHDFTVLDRVMPHPVYGKMYWLCVLNPGAATFEQVKGFLAEAYAAASRRSTKKA